MWCDDNDDLIAQDEAYARKLKKALKTPQPSPTEDRADTDKTSALGEFGTVVAGGSPMDGGIVSAAVKIHEGERKAKFRADLEKAARGEPHKSPLDWIAHRIFGFDY